MSQQPEWKVYKSLGDIGIIFKDATEVYEYEAEIWQEYETERGKPRFQVYRFPLARKSLHDGMIIPFGFHQRNDLPHPIEKYEEWYSEDLGSVARSSGVPLKELRNALVSEDPEIRFDAYFDIGSYHGFDNFDGYPLDLSEEQLDARVTKITS